MQPFFFFFSYQSCQSIQNYEKTTLSLSLKVAFVINATIFSASQVFRVMKYGLCSVKK